MEPSTQEQIGPLTYVSGQGDPTELWATFARGGSLLVSTQLAERYNLRKGDTLRLQTARGIQDLPVTAVIVDYNSTRGTVMMTWDDLRQFFGLNDVGWYLLKLNPGANANAVRQQIETQYGRAGHLTVQSNSEVKQNLLQGIGTVMLAFNFIVLIAFVIAAFGIVNTMTMSVIERTREIGVLQALGMTRFQVGKMILAEALVLGVISGLFGLAFGGVFSRVVVWSMNSGFGFHVNYVWPVVALLVSCVLGLGISQLAALLPARRASGLAVIEALRYE
jgi:putative ABC transport system permease protein